MLGCDSDGGGVRGGHIECGRGLDVCGGCCWLGFKSFAVISRLPMLASFLLQKSGVVFPRNFE